MDVMKKITWYSGGAVALDWYGAPAVPLRQEIVSLPMSNFILLSGEADETRNTNNQNKKGNRKW